VILSLGVLLPEDTRYVDLLEDIKHMYMVTREWMNKFKTPRGSWNKPQIESLGIRWPLRSGWRTRIEGINITDSQRLQFEANKLIGSKKRYDLASSFTNVIQNFESLDDDQKDQIYDALMNVGYRKHDEVEYI